MTRAGPLWTRARLARVLQLRFGVGRAGHPDTAAVASAMGVSRRTVQRWLHTSSGRSLAHIPDRRLEQLLLLLGPSEETIRKEAQKARYATKAISGLHLPRKMGIKPAWERQRWLEQHTVSILETTQAGQVKIRQLTTSRTTALDAAELRRRGRLVSQVEVPTRFHATVLTHAVLGRVGPWRFHAGTDQLQQGFTQAWIADAPQVDLAQVQQDLIAPPQAAGTAARRRRRKTDRSGA